MIDNRDESMVLDLLDDTVQRLTIFRNHVIDTEAIAHAAAQALGEATEPDPGTDRPLSRVQSLATSAAEKIRGLLDELTVWLVELEGQRGGADEA